MKWSVPDRRRLGRSCGEKARGGGVRNLLVYRVADNAFLVYGFAKNAHANISAEELKALKRLAKELLSYTDKALTDAVENGVLIELEEVENGG